MMTEAKRVRVSGLPLRATDAVVLGGFVTLLALAAILPGRVEHPVAVIARIVVCVGLHIGAILALERLKLKGLRFFVRTGSVQLMLLQVYLVALPLQRLFFSWNDRLVLKVEQTVFGVQPLVWIQRFYTPGLTEWMMFVYVVYVIIYPILGAFIFFERGEDANEDYLFNLGLANLTCALGFILFPVAGPLLTPAVQPLLDVPLKGGVFTFLGEYIRTNVHQPGGTIPSPHCAVATVMWIMSRRYTRRGFFLLAPVIVSLYVSTVYGRYHYVSDGVVGIAAGLFVVGVAPALALAWNRRADRTMERAR